MKRLAMGATISQSRVTMKLMRQIPGPLAWVYPWESWEVLEVVILFPEDRTLCCIISGPTNSGYALMIRTHHKQNCQVLLPPLPPAPFYSMRLMSNCSDLASVKLHPVSTFTPTIFFMSPHQNQPVLSRSLRPRCPT